jgi:hypothetical protein
MISMASCAGWCAQVAASRHRLMVDACAVFLELVGGDTVRLHMRSIGVATGTGLCDVERVNLRSCVTHRPQVVYAVAIRADRHFCVALFEKLSVNARLVLAKLIGSQRWVVLPHVSPVSVTLPAQPWNLAPFDLPPESCRLAHGVQVRLLRITAMTTGAVQPFLRMNVSRELFFGYPAGRILYRVAVKAGVDGLRVGNACAREQQQCHPQD